MHYHEWTKANYHETRRAVNMTMSDILSGPKDEPLNPGQLDALKDCWEIMDKAQEVMHEMGHDLKSEMHGDAHMHAPTIR